MFSQENVKIGQNVGETSRDSRHYENITECQGTVKALEKLATILGKYLQINPRFIGILENRICQIFRSQNDITFYRLN